MVKSVAKSGLDVLVAGKLERIRGANIALLINQSAVDSNFRHILENVAAEPSVEIKVIFAPEHGLWGGPQDMEGVPSGKEPHTNAPIISLYDGTSQSLAPREEDLKGIDILVIDLPDIGSRYYTYAQTAALAMDVAGKVGTKVVVLDRPNPIGGIKVEGSPLIKKYRSFCGMLTVPQRHGLTLGELCVMYERGFGKEPDTYPRCECDLEVIRCEGWKRNQHVDETAVPWVIPSPNMPTLNTALVYPGGCLFEGTNISEGRGTTLPFEYLGAPFVDGFLWHEKLKSEKLELRGAVLRPVSFIPKFQKWANQVCGGVQIHITDRNSFNPFRWGLALISSLKKLYPTQFRWRTDTYEFIDNIPAIDLLYGSEKFRVIVDSGGDISELEAEIGAFEREYQISREPYLLY